MNENKKIASDVHNVNPLPVFLLIGACLFYTLTYEFWHPSLDKSLTAIYDDKTLSYNLFYGHGEDIESTPAWQVKAFPPLDELYIVDIGKNNWRLVREQIKTIKTDNPRGRLETDVLEKIIESHNKKFYPETIRFTELPFPNELAMRNLREWFNRYIFKKINKP